LARQQVLVQPRTCTDRAICEFDERRMLLRGDVLAIERVAEMNPEPNPITIP
jgi:hypothetical protein